MTLLLALIIGQSYATATTETRVPLVVNADNAPAIQGLLDAAAEGSVVKIPSGVWNVHTALRISKHGLTLKGEPGSTLRIIGQNVSTRVLIAGDGNTPKVNNTTLEGITFDAGGLTGTGTHSCIGYYGDNFTMRRCRILNSHHEGAAGSGYGALIEDCEAVNCGNGNETYSQSTAAFNFFAVGLTMRRCTAKGCGQGFEVSRFDSTFEDCEASEPGPGSPSIAFNVGSDVCGISNLKLIRCVAKGYGQGVQCGNGLGRFENLEIRDCLFIDSPVSLAGGVPENRLVTPEYPARGDTGTSSVTGCRFVVTKTSGGALNINTGPSASGAVQGRENWVWRNNTFIGKAEVDYTSNCLLCIQGNQTGTVTIEDNLLTGLDAPSSWGDFAVVSNNANKAAPGQPGLTLRRNRVFKSDGTERTLVVKVEGK